MPSHSLMNRRTLLKGVGGVTFSTSIPATLLLLFAASTALALDPTRTLAEFDTEDSGKAVWYVLRWVSTTGQPGPWGPVFAAVVP